MTKTEPTTDHEWHSWDEKRKAGWRIVCVTYWPRVVAHVKWAGDDFVVFAVNQNYNRAWFRFPNNTPEHVAFVRGIMPPYVYADFVEERHPDFPAEGLRLLRGWGQPEVSRAGE